MTIKALAAALLPTLRATAFTALLAVAATASAQSLRLSGSGCLTGQAPSSTTASPHASSCDAGSFSVGLADARVGATTVGVELSYRFGARFGAHVGASPDSAGVGQVGLNLSANEVFGPLGNVVFEMTGAVRTDGLGEATLGARGVIGPVAARLALGVHGADEATFDPLALASDERPSFGGFSAGLRLGLTGRLERNLIVEAAPELYLTSTGLAGRLATRVRLLRAIGANELRLLARAGATPGFEAVYGAVGAGVNFPRGRAPDLDVALYVGVADGRVRPGVTVDLVQDLGGGLRLGLAAAVEPYRLDVHPGRAHLSLETPVGDGRLQLALAGAFLDAERPAAVVVKTSFSLPVTLPSGTQPN